MWKQDLVTILGYDIEMTPKVEQNLQFLSDNFFICNLSNTSHSYISPVYRHNDVRKH